jgi:hypothetical protein
MVAVTPKAVTDGLLLQELPDELLIYDTRRSETHCLNAAAALVWRACDGQRTVAAIAAKVAPDLSPADAEALVQDALAQLSARHLLEVPVEPPPPADHQLGARVSRRLVLGLGVATGLAAPMIESIVSPPAALAASGITGGTCGATG